MIVVDNGSSDGSYELLQERFGDSATVVRLEEGLVGAVRNFGAKHAEGDYLSFIDADCTIKPDYFSLAVGVLRETEAVATGSRYRYPTNAAWIEKVWHELNVKPDGDTHHLPGSNFFIERAVFEEAGGFDESLPSGEEPELCQRLLAAGHRLYASQDVEVVHLGGPRTLWGFWRQQVWQSLGMLATVRPGRLDKPVVMLTLFGLLLLGAIGVLVFGPGSAGVRVAIAGGLVLSVPAATVAYRYLQIGRVHRPFASLVIYTTYYFARLVSLGHVLLGRKHSVQARSTASWD